MPPARRHAIARNGVPHGLAIDRFPWSAVAASIVVHAVIFTLLLNAPLPKRSSPTGDRVITMRLATQATSEPAPALETETLETKTPPMRPPPQEQPQAPDDSDTVTADRGPANPASMPHAPEPDTPVSEPQDSPGRNAAGLRARILEQVGAQPVAPAADQAGSLPWATTGEALSGLPGTRGWISEYVGRVAPGADTWKASDGSSRSRYVMADGTVVCTRRRAPTIDELMNPWKSTVVTMARICGRERPEAPDFTDPRVQPPPRRVVENTPGLDH